MQRMLGAELAEHLGYKHGTEAPPVQTNRRNGVSRKTVKSEDGAFEIEVPRDRDGSFEPRLIARGRTRIDGLDDKIIAMYARGMSVRDIRGHLEELYGLEVSPDLPLVAASSDCRATDQPGDGCRARRGEGMAFKSAGYRLSDRDLRCSTGEDPRQGQPDRQEQGRLPRPRRHG